MVRPMSDILTITLNPALDVATSVDAVVPGPKLRCAEPRYDPGGGGVNVSRALQRLEGSSHAFVAFGGETGLKGKVNSHFFERFGSAMLLSVVGGLTSVVSSGSSVVIGGGQSAAAAAVQQGGTLGPTIRVRQGEPIRVFTAKDLDFSQVQ